MRRRSPASASRHAAEPGLGEGLLTGVELSTARNLVGWRPHDGHPAVVALDAVECEGAIDGTIALQRATNAATAVHTATKAEQSRFSISISRAGRCGRKHSPPPLTVIQFDTKGWNLKLAKYSRWSENIA